MIISLTIVYLPYWFNLIWCTFIMLHMFYPLIFVYVTPATILWFSSCDLTQIKHIHECFDHNMYSG